VDKQDQTTGNTIGFSAEAEANDVILTYYNSIAYFPTGAASGTRYVYWLIESDASYEITVTANYNSYDDTAINPAAFAGVQVEAGEITGLSWAEWKTFTSFGSAPDANSINAANGNAEEMDDYWIDAANHNYTITSSSSPLINAGTYLSSPSQVLADRAGRTRADPPEIGPYEFGFYFESGGNNSFSSGGSGYFEAP
jgi:hypothetical protein